MRTSLYRFRDLSGWSVMVRPGFLHPKERDEKRIVGRNSVKRRSGEPIDLGRIGQEGAHIMPACTRLRPEFSLLERPLMRT